MSYFVFGCAIVTSPRCRPVNIVTAAEGEAVRQGLHVLLDEKIPQGVIGEMLDEQVGPKLACAFLITSRAGEDTSDSLISPFECSSDQMSQALTSLERWADGLLCAVPGIAISLFFTEGYETTFSARKGAIPGWAMQIAQLVADEGDIPSLRIDLTALHKAP